MILCCAFWSRTAASARFGHGVFGPKDIGVISKGRRMVMEIIREQAPDVILMAPVCGPWSNTQNIQQDQQKVGEKRRRYLPMVDFVASIARYQLKHRRYFIIENPQTSRIWYLNFEPFTIKQVDILRKETEAIDKEFNMTSSSLAVRIQDLPFNKDVQPLVIQGPLVQKFQKTMKQKQDLNDWRCQNMWNGCKKLRQLCISSTQYDAYTAYVHTIGRRCNHILLAA